MNRHSTKVGMFSVPLLLTVLLTASGVSAQTTVSSCGTLAIPDETYVLDQDILDSTTDSCIVLGADNIVFDCDGFTIDSDTGSGAIATGFIFSSNAVVKNCVLTDWVDVTIVDGLNSQGIDIINTTIVSPDYTCIDFREGSIGSVFNSSLNCNLGIVIAGEDFHVENNLIQTTNDLSIKMIGNNITIKNNTLNSQQGAIVIQDTDNVSSGSQISINDNIISWSGTGIEVADGTTVTGSLIFNNFFVNSSFPIQDSSEGISLNITLQAGEPVTNRVFGLDFSLIGGNYYTGFSDDVDMCQDSEPDGICDVTHTPDSITDFLPLSNGQSPEQASIITGAFTIGSSVIAPIILIILALSGLLFTIRNLTSCHSLDSKKIAETCVLTIVLVSLLSIAFTIA